ncbi:MAG: hypothetical protein CMB99_06135 [Flavobacteriaceae bacterium]|nr:hypothetical protein [Flavobacteriaceae bacterium]|tara:strand:+ start:3589 stop:4200 length:612 start_codon:yes stop_codon:yes gene_type:complete
MRRLSLLFLLLILTACNSDRKRPIVGETDYQITQNNIFKDGSKSPLKKKDLKNFRGLDFYPVDSSFVVTASITLYEESPIFEMATTTDRKPLYREYGLLNFKIDTTNCQLTVYQNIDDLQQEETEDLLFLPFTDDTSGNGSYGGGRYMDLRITDIQEDNTLLLNFNNTYNPYCAYNEMYSCPLTPRKNHLNVEIKAGVKDFKK